MKILFVTDMLSPSINGVSIRNKHWIREFRKLGHEVTVFGPKGSDDVDHEMQAILNPYNPDCKMSYFSAALLREIVSGRYDVIHISYFMFPILYQQILPLARLKNIPIVLSHHFNMMKSTRKYALNEVHHKFMVSFIKYSVLGHINRNVSKFIVPSSESLRDIRLFGIKCPSGMVSTGIENEVFNESKIHSHATEELRKFYQEKTGCKDIVLYVGRIAHEKNLKIFVETAKQLKDVGFVIIGDGPLADDYKKAYASCSNIHFEETKEHKQLAEYYAAADIFFSPSKEETFGFTFLESVACGTPIIVFNHEPMKTIHKNVKEWLIEPSTSKEIEIQRAAKKIRAMLVGDRRKQREQALKHAEQFSWEKSAQDAIDIYKSVQGTGKRSVKDIFIFPLNVVDLLIKVPINLVVLASIRFQFRKEVKAYKAQNKSR